jgi:hypothetical protein
VRRTRVRDNGLIVAEVDWHDDPPPQRLRPEHGLLGILLQRLVQRFGGVFTGAEQRLFDDAAWVGYRLSQQLWLMLDSPLAPHSVMLTWVPPFSPTADCDCTFNDLHRNSDATKPAHSEIDPLLFWRQPFI